VEQLSQGETEARRAKSREDIIRSPMLRDLELS